MTAFFKRSENVSKTSWKHVNKNRLSQWYVLNRSLRHQCKTSWRSFEDVLKRLSKTSWKRLCKTSWRRMTKSNVLVLIKTSWRCLEDVFWRRMSKVNIFVLMMTSWRRFLKTKAKDVFIKTNVFWVLSKNCISCDLYSISIRSVL